MRPLYHSSTNALRQPPGESTGSCGIGTYTPEAKLDVNGDIRVTDLKVVSTIDMTGATFVIDDTHEADRNVKELTIGNLNVT